MRYGFIAMTAVLAVASSSFGAAITWVPPAGSNATFSYANGQNLNGDLGNPTVSATGFSFGPANYRSSASNGGTDDTSDTAQVDVTAAAGKKLTSVSASILGDYTILGTGTVNAIGAVAATNLDTNAVLALPIVFTGTPATTATSTSGIFSGTVTINFPGGWSRAHLDFASTISSSAGAASSALIQVKDADLTVTVPEPTLMVGFVGLAMIVRRRR